MKKEMLEFLNYINENTFLINNEIECMTFDWVGIDGGDSTIIFNINNKSSICYPNIQLCLGELKNLMKNRVLQMDNCLIETKEKNYQHLLLEFDFEDRYGLKYIQK